MAPAPRTLPNERRRAVLQRLAIHPLLRRMAARQGIDLTATWGRGQERLLHDALDRCAACAQARSCRVWLATTASGPGYPAYCRNAETIEAFRIMDPRAFPLPHTGHVPRGAMRLKEALADPLVQEVMRAARPNTERLLALLDGWPHRLVQRLATPIEPPRAASRTGARTTGGPRRQSRRTSAPPADGRERKTAAADADRGAPHGA